MTREIVVNERIKFTIFIHHTFEHCPEIFSTECRSRKEFFPAKFYFNDFEKMMKRETSIKQNRDTFMYSLRSSMRKKAMPLKIFTIGIHWTLGDSDRYVLPVSQRCLFHGASFLFSMRVKRKNVAKTVRG